MALWYALNSPLDTVLFGDHATSASSQGRCSAPHPVHPYKRPLSAASHVDAKHHVDIIEKAAAYEFIADAPGFSPSDINVEIEDQVLTISGKQQQERKQQQQQQQPGREQAQPQEEVKVWRSERRLRQFSRSFELPGDANTEDITASLDMGVLTVRVAKLPPAPKPVPRHIAVHSAAVPAAC